MKSMAPKIVLRSAIGQSSLSQPVVDKDGWQKVMNRRSRRRVKMERRPRREVPQDLRGWCFNCFASSHLAAACRSQTCCFRCCEPGHRSYACPRRRGKTEPMEQKQAAHKLPDARRMVWRPVQAAIQTTQASDCKGGEPPRRRVRRRRRPARKENNNQLPPFDLEESVEPILERSGVTARTGPADVMSRPLCIIDRSASIDQAEADLRRVLFVIIGGTRPPVTANQVIEEVARSFNVEVSAMAAMMTAPEDFLLLLPDCGAADRVYNGGLPLHCPGYSLRFRR